MLVRIRKTKRALAAGLVSAFAFALISCASHKQNMALVDDPTGQKESTIPWNKREKWEDTGPLSGLSDRR